ncbi:MAG: hypothetical protein AAB686_02190 [Patescibacteria group bacterium]
MQGRKISLKTSEHRWIKKLTDLTTLLDDQSIADILLVWSGFKPGALVEISWTPHAAISREGFHKTVSDFEEVLRKLRLQYALKKNYPKTIRTRTAYTCIARDERMLKKLTAALGEEDKKMRRLKIGVLLGYPKTALAAFANNKQFNSRDLPQPVSKAKEFKFLNFRLSQNWQEESGYLREKAREVKRLSPELYARIVKAPS